MDMQYLRMFVRRYLVHTSEGNNPRQVPLYAFVTVRGACPNVDRELVNQIAREELPGLMKVDRAIEKDKKRQQSREILQEQAIREYRAPPGLFSNTGVLYLTNTPQSTFVSAISVMFFTIIFAVFLIVSRAVTADPLIVAYVSQITHFLVVSLCVWIVASVTIGVHAIHMHIPLSDNQWLLTVRAVMTLAAVTCVILSLVPLMGRMRNQSLYNFLAFRAGSLLCDFYRQHQCSGFTSSCIDLYYRDPQLCKNCSSTLDFSTICYYELWSQLQIVCIPLLVFCVFILLALALSIFQFVRLWLIARTLRNQNI
ncbi:hypothetical protein ABL78_6959 [Leptomonas seymouri]|uniref:Uncharacterized protein n=1 Tax=Leptomonas seymouri TaxID=5684 RepID=A0A0N1IID8_LEPSE|nr:hypothetical protein ABL78_6959 [Leptomonas seymouri]|eukprot:KPI83984.1 hypothetical protein ABL78_6959 [Leptomonas seymouri]